MSTGADGVAALITVEVAYATPQRQVLKSLQLATGSTVRSAIKSSAILDDFPGLEVDPKRVGIFGRKVSLDHVLREGDRVEIYRPLIADPKEARRRRAQKDD